jgi:uncharacterized membrane protein
VAHQAFLKVTVVNIAVVAAVLAQVHLKVLEHQVDAVVDHEVVQQFGDIRVMTLS